MMLKATEIRRGMVITMEGINYVVVDFAHHTPGNLRDGSDQAPEHE